MNLTRVLILLVLIASAVGLTVYLLPVNVGSDFNVKLPQEPEALAAPETSLASPDGKEILKMERKSEDDSVVYTFTTSQGLFFTKTEAKTNSISIPFNSWSPDNKYVFLKETVGGKDNFLVLSATNKQFKDGIQYLNVTDFFGQKLPKHKLTDITGWASPMLLVVRTNLENGEDGPSFWFDLTNQSFIQLSSKF